MPFLPTSAAPRRNIPQLTTDRPMATSPLRHAEIGKKGTTGVRGINAKAQRQQDDAEPERKPLR